MKIKVGSKKAGSYIDFMNNNPSDEFEVLARGSHTAKAVYVSAVMKQNGYDIVNVDIEAIDVGQEEPLAVLSILMKAKGEKNGSS